ncbi:MAG: lactam utilization protein LamB [Flavobacteriales bacterium]|mgnify:FL=1|nr:lactam utilization protein LamB [Flavobacteriales bacterium]|tara:strand:- start:721 stop:1461 length:741 start_codon:yes stop_codon:yes gene_type:complete
MINKFFLDINCDVGEGLKNESELFPLISSCNIACGGHAGDENSMIDVVLLAKKHHLNIGAHPSYPDKKNFGRKKIKISIKKLKESIENQIISLRDILKRENLKLNHIKPHGALYNFASNDMETAIIIIDLVKKFNVKLYAPYNSLMSKLARDKGINTIIELFLDRNYNSDYSLVDRQNKDAVITNPKNMIEHLDNILNNKIVAIDNININVEFDTLCIHGDNTKAIEMLLNINKHLKSKGISIKKY